MSALKEKLKKALIATSLLGIISESLFWLNLAKKRKILWPIEASL